MANYVCLYRRRILICVCTPCVLVACLLIYVMLAVCLAMTRSVLPIIQQRSSLPLFFTATGATNSGTVAPYPIKPFWRPNIYNEAFWNLIQLDLDRKHNPILRPSMDANLSSPDTVFTNSQIKPKSGCSPNYEIMWSMSDFFTLPEQMQRFVISMHCRDYPLLINQPGLCDNMLSKERPPTLLLAIKSQAQNFENRRVIRRTWGRSGWVKGQVGRGGVVRRIFLLGYTEPKNDTEERLQEESEMYGDIIRWNFIDSFFNLTLKDVLFWDWFSKHCPYSRYVFKGDDDVFVRTPALLDYLQHVEVRSKNPGPTKVQEDFIVGDVITSAVPPHVKDNKYFIPETFYKGIYPSYAGGGGVVYSGSLVRRLLQVSKRVHLFPIDDVYLGMCLQRLGVIPTHHPAFLTFDFPKEDVKKPCVHHTILLVHKRSPKEIMKLWVETRTPSPKCRNATLRADVPEKKTSDQTKTAAKNCSKWKSEQRLKRYMEH